MATGPVGRAFVQVFADLSKFSPDLREKIKAAFDEHTKDLPMEELDKSAKKAGEKAADDLADSTKKRLDVRMKEVANKFEAGFLNGVKGTGAALTASLIPALIGLAVEGVAALAPLTLALGATIPALVVSAAATMGVLKMATSGVGAALKDAFDPAKAKQFEQEMAKLAPAAQGFVREIQGIHPLMTVLQQDVQQTFFVQFHGALTMMVKSLFPQLRAGLHQISADLGQIVNVLLRRLAGSRAELGVIFSDMHRALVPLIPLIGEFAHSMLVIGAAASPLINMLSAGFADLLRQFTGFINAESRSGGLAQFFRDAAVVLHQVAGLLGNLWGLLMQIIGALQQTGSQGIGVLSSLIGMLAEFFGSAQGHMMLVSLFNLLNVALRTMNTVLPPLLPPLAQLITMLANQLTAAIIWLTPWLEKITKFIGQHPQLLAAAAAAWAAFRAVLIGVAIAEALVDLLNPAGIIALAIAAIIAGVILIASQWGVIEKALKKAWKAVEDFFLGIWRWIVSVGKDIGHWFADTLPNFFASIPDKIMAFISSIPMMLWNLFTDALRRVGEAIGIGTGLLIYVFFKLPGQIWDALVGLGLMLWNLMVSAFEITKHAVSVGVDAVLDFFEKLPNRIWTFIKSIPGLIRDAWHTAWAWAKKEVSDGADAVVDFVRKLPGRISGFFSRVGSDILGGLKSGINAVIAGFNSGIDKVGHMVGISMPHLPMLATGGLISRPTLAVVGEAGPEAVVPMSDPTRAADVAKRTGLLDILGTRMGNLGVPIVHIYLGTKEITDILDKRIEHALDGQGAALAYGVR